MRVVAGEARGRRLRGAARRDHPADLDRVREAVFNALGSLGAVDGAPVLDLFAGCGALGIEALSRGAAHAVFVERDPGVRRVLAANLGVDRPRRSAEVVAADGASLPRSLAGADGGPAFDLVLLDPPYADDRVGRLPRRVASAGPRRDRRGDRVRPRAVALPEPWHVLREKRYGGTLPRHRQSPPPEIS